MGWLDALFPKRCVFCRALLGFAHTEPPYLCAGCQKALPWCSSQEPEVFAPLYYRDAARLAIHRYKFNGSVSYARTFGYLMAQAVRAEDFDLVTWVPCSLLRRLKRRFDQSELLARELSEQLGLPLRPLLRRKRHGRAQFRQKSAAGRRENVRNAYAARSASLNRPAPETRLLLVDDIYTTGATFQECRRALREAGLVSVSLVCVARKPSVARN